MSKDGSVRKGHSEVYHNLACNIVDGTLVFRMGEIGFDFFHQTYLLQLGLEGLEV